MAAAALILVAVIFWSASGNAQTTSNRARSKGPRAVAILEFDTKKQVHLVPVTIMLNGDFFDASIYKASPVPMALEPETVYEGVRSGISQGVFTVARAHQVLGNWVGEGNWEPVDLNKPTKKPAPLAPVEETDDKPPVLRRHGSEKPATPAPTPAPTPPPTASPKDTDTVRVGGKAKDTKETKEAMEPSERPVLRRGAPEKTEPDASFYEANSTKSWTVVATISAVSDAKEENARSYHYVLVPDQERELLEKVQALAMKELHTRAGSSVDAPPVRTAKASKAKADSQSKFKDVKFQAYDPSTTNEPIFVFEANTPVMDKLSGKELPNHVMLVVREDIYGDLHVIFSSISDPMHMDSQPRCEFVDVVDAEGDGYGELLLRRTYESGRAFSVYRVIGNQLWPLFEGKP